MSLTRARRPPGFWSTAAFQHLAFLGLLLCSSSELLLLLCACVTGLHAVLAAT